MEIAHPDIIVAYFCWKFSIWLEKLLALILFVDAIFYTSHARAMREMDWYMTTKDMLPVKKSPKSWNVSFNQCPKASVITCTSVSLCIHKDLTACGVTASVFHISITHCYHCLIYMFVHFILLLTLLFTSLNPKLPQKASKCVPEYSAFILKIVSVAIKKWEFWSKLLFSVQTADIYVF